MNVKKISGLYRQILIELGCDVESEGLQGTPDRVARFWSEFIDYRAGNINTTFESVSTDQMVIVSNINVWSLCEHHLLPFSCKIGIGYIARDRVLGLSKFARIAHKHAHKLQLQERLVHNISDEIQKLINSDDVAVIGRGSHTCMTMRGIRSDGLMTTSVMRGVFLTKPEARREFLDLSLHG